MATELQGLSAQGVTISGRKDFSSFPGLLMWIDPRVNVTFHPSSTRVKTYQERSQYGFSWTEQAGSAGVSKITTTTPIDPHHVFSIPGTNQSGFEPVSTPNLSAIAPLMNGSPFSFYMLTRVGSGSGGSGNRYNPFGVNRFRVILHPRSADRWVQVICADDANVTRLSCLTPDGSYSLDAWTLIEVKHRGYLAAGNDCELYINDVLKATANWSGAPGTTFSALPQLGNANMGGTGLLSLTLAYDHFGKTETQIDNERAEIRALITELYNI